MEKREKAPKNMNKNLLYTLTYTLNNSIITTTQSLCILILYSTEIETNVYFFPCILHQRLMREIERGLGDPT